MILKETLEYAECDAPICWTRALLKPADFDDGEYTEYLRLIGWTVGDGRHTCPDCVKERSRIEDKNDDL